MKRILEFVSNSFWAMNEEKLYAMTQLISRRAANIRLSSDEITANIVAANGGKDPRKTAKTHDVVSGRAVIPVVGVLSKYAPQVHDISTPAGASCEDVEKQIRDALADPAVTQIVLDVDSPGGSVSGIAALADFIRSSSKQKPIYAYVNGCCASAAYWLAAATNGIYASQCSFIGSIGVYMIVQDFSAALEQDGIKEKLIKAGQFKGLGTPSQPLTDEGVQVLQEGVDDIYAMFVGAVAKYRGMSVESVLGIADGRDFISEKALGHGLIDGIGSLDIVPQSSSAKAKEVRMLKDQLKAEHGALYAEVLAEGKAEGLKEASASVEAAIKAERERVEQIVAHAQKEFLGKGVESIMLKAIGEGHAFDRARADMGQHVLAQVIAATPASPGAVASEDAATASSKDILGNLPKVRAYAKENNITLAQALSELRAKK